MEQVTQLLQLAHFYQRQSILSGEAHLASCVMAGAALEAILIAVINVFYRDAEQTPDVVVGKKLKLEKLVEWHLFDLLKVAKDAQLLPDELTIDPKLDPRVLQDRRPVSADSTRTTRNLVHPGRFVSEREGREFTKLELLTLRATCHAAYQALSEKFRARYPNLPVWMSERTVIL